MSFPIEMNKFTDGSLQKINQLKERIKEADAILIGAGAGLSTAAGFTYTGERFQKYFSDFEKKYHFHDMYSGGFYNFATKEEFWAYWSRYIYINRYMDPPKSVYKNLLKLVSDKDYFVLTTNVDHCFQKAGFDKKRLFYTQGDYGLFQCSVPCCNMTYDNELLIERMVKEQEDMRIPSKYLPICPKCGKPLSMNLRSDDTFVQDKHWYEAANRYSEFVKRIQNSNQKFLCLELGVGYNTPGIIKYNFQSLVENNVDATYVCINKDEDEIPKSIENRSILIQDDCDEIISFLLQT